ncbi:MAG TPA: siderophore-interacting protein [Rhizomicrobium sp.]|jgi:NADPH-dependent ferric siderophore reductase|nr:siderophore-interacting protein [Rhizomicrobium sp.]
MSLAEPKSPGAVAQLALFLARKGRRVWRLTVRRKLQLTPRMLRIEFSGTDLDEFVYKPGQDLVLELPQPGGAVARRHYTIRQLDPATRMLAIDFVLHGASPADDWVRAAQPGDSIAVAGPRGHTHLREADWHLFVGDETGIPGIGAMLEGLPRGEKAFAFLEIADADEKQDLATDATVVWLPRGGAPAGPSRILYDAVEAFAFPQGFGHAYIVGETSNVRAIRQRLIARGLGKERSCAEGYWRPGRVGGHDHA